MKTIKLKLSSHAINRFIDRCGTAPDNLKAITKGLTDTHEGERYVYFNLYQLCIPIVYNETDNYYIAKTIMEYKDSIVCVPSWMAVDINIEWID